MQEYKSVMWLGAWLVLIPLLGVPGSWEDTLVILTGLCLIVVAVLRIHARFVLLRKGGSTPAQKAPEARERGDV